MEDNHFQHKIINLYSGMSKLYFNSRYWHCVRIENIVYLRRKEITINKQVRKWRKYEDIGLSSFIFFCLVIKTLHCISLLIFPYEYIESQHDQNQASIYHIILLYFIWMFICFIWYVFYEFIDLSIEFKINIFVFNKHIDKYTS